MKMENNIVDRSTLVSEKNLPSPPPLPSSSTSYRSAMYRSSSSSSSSSNDLWDRLFDEAYRADVTIQTENRGIVYAHAGILSTASPVIKGMLKQSKKSNNRRRQSISILGVPHDAVRVFIRFLYSSRYEKEDMDEFAMHLLVLSHVYVVPQLKRECERSLERSDSLKIENAVDIFQLALLCDAPRLGLISHRMIVANLESLLGTEGWASMKQSHPVLEKTILQSAVEETNRRNEATRRKNERKVYMQLSEAMEALVHICKDGCRTIGPHGKELRATKEPCQFSSCKGLESLIRHLAGCKLRVPAGCVHCKRIWQLLELHSRLCAHSDTCKVPLCRNFKDKTRKQSKKEDIKWRVLVKNILRANAISGRPFLSWAISNSYENYISDDNNNLENILDRVVIL